MKRSKFFSERLGIPVTKDEPTIAIGGNVDGVSPLQVAGAFASLVIKVITINHRL